MTLRAGLVLFPGLTQLDLTGPYEVFSRTPGVETLLVGANLEPVRSEFGLTIQPQVDFESCPPLDILCVPGGSGTLALSEDEAALSFLRRTAQQAKYVTSVCTGSLVLGAAGLLRGYRATTHWLSLDLLPLFGAIPVRERVVVDRNRITGGGVTAGIDFALTIASQIVGRDAAEEIQLMIEYNPAPPVDRGHPDKARPEILETVLNKRAAFQKKRRETYERIMRAQ